MSESVTLKSYFYEVLIPSSQKNTSSPIEDILHHVSISFMKKLALYKCFNPRTHTGCDESLSFEPINFHVSIHAPTRGATTWSLIRRSLTKGFNPRTHTGCDLQSEKHPLRIPFGFNPRTHTGCDTFSGSLDGIWAKFQSTHPHGVRPSLPWTISIDRRFQSTHPHGVRRLRTVNTIHRSKFQSTHPHGVRPLMLSIDKQGIVSIHAPTRGATFNPGLL